MSSRAKFTTGLVLVLVATMPSCRDHADIVGATRTTSATIPAVAVMGTNDGVGRLVEARCSHQQLCREIGEIARPNGCGQDVRAAIGDQLVAGCAGGVAASKIDACAKALRDATCGAALGSATLPDACRTSALCVPRERAR